MRRTRIQVVNVFVGLALFVIITFLVLNIEHKRYSRSTNSTHVFRQEVFIVRNHTPNVDPSFNDIDISKLSSDSLNRILENIIGRISHLEHQLENPKLISLTSDPVLNEHNFSYIHTPANNCSDSWAETLLAVASPATNFNRRSRIRHEHYGGDAAITNNNVKLVFFLGTPSNNKYRNRHQLHIDNEAGTFNDIVQHSYEDIYKYIGRKSVSMFKWASVFCHKVKFIIRTDDDITFNMTSIVSVLERIAKSESNFVVGSIRNNDTATFKNKRKSSLNASNSVPSHFLGDLQGFPGSTATFLLEAALRVDSVWLEDISVTGACALKGKIPILTDPSFVYKYI